MQFLKKIAVAGIIPYLENMVRVYWLYWLAGLIEILLIILLVFLIRRRRAKETTAGGHKTKLALLRIWKEFVRAIPAKFRRSIMLYQHFVVLGESGVGKSLLIDNYTDWQGQANQFYPSYTTDPLLQIYLGSRVIVQELSAGLLTDSSKQARRALLKLWRPLFRAKEPTVVVVLNGAALPSDTPESLKRQAQVIRGKINLLALSRKKPVKVCLALTHLDQLEGFEEFSAFIRHNNIPLKLEFSSKKDLLNLKNCLEPYEDYLSLALTTLPARDYMKIISFLRYAPEVFSTLSVFIKILQAPDPLSPEPQIIRLSLTSGRGAENVTNPFVSSFSIKEAKYDPFLKHKRAAAALATIGVLYLGAGYMYERYLLIKTNRMMDIVKACPPVQYNEIMHNLLLDYTDRLNKYPLLNFVPDFFAAYTRQKRRRLLNSIRKCYLLPELQGDVEPEKMLYLLGLIYASPSNELDKFILNHIAEWKKSLGFSETLINDYLKYNDIPPDLDRLVLDRISKKSFFFATTLRADSFNRQRWMVFWREASKSSQKPFLTQSSWQELQKEGRGLLQDIKEYQRYDFYLKIYELLQKESPSVARRLGIEKNEYSSQMKQKSILEFLNFLQKLDMKYPPVRDLNLYQFLENIKAMQVLDKDKERKKFRFSFGDKEFIFSTQRWNELIDCSRMTLFMRDFINQNKLHDGLLFFQTENRFPDLVMNADNKGHLFFTGKGRVDGLYTKAAFEEAVKPVLLELPELLQKLSVTEEMKTLFSNFISKEVGAYAEDYVAEYQKYYHQFEVESSSLWELKYVLNQMRLPSSQFQDFLLTIKKNTDLNLEGSPYLQRFASKLHTFDFIQRLMQERKGVFTELEQYKAILSRMYDDLEGGPFVVENEMDEANELKSRLSPVGRISLAILRREDASYLKLINKWIENIGIDSEWQDLFLSPVYDAYLLGLSEVNKSIKAVWDEMWSSHIRPIVNKFPFNRRAAREVTQLDLKALVPPQGDFWKTFRKYLLPVCIKNGDIWVQRISPLEPLQLPLNMLKTVNEMVRITKTFWDDNGVAKPVIFSIKPLPLPPLGKNKPVVVLSYLRSGKSSVFGFNQQPTWHDFKFEWWKEPSASVGVEYTNSINSRKKQRTVSAPESCWSFYQLLRMAQRTDKNLLRWRMKIASKRKGSISVRFAIKNDPWALFQGLPVSLTQNKNY